MWKMPCLQLVFSLLLFFSLFLSLPFSPRYHALTVWSTYQSILHFFFSLLDLFFRRVSTHIYICFSSSSLPRRLPFFLNTDAKARRSEFVDKLCVTQGYLPVVYIERVLRRSTHTRVVAYVRTISDYVPADFLLFSFFSSRRARLFSFSFFFLLSIRACCC